MSKAARLRRQKKAKEQDKRRSQRRAEASSAGFGNASGGGPRSDAFARGRSEQTQRQRASVLVSTAVEAVCSENQPVLDRTLKRLADSSSPAWTNVVSRCLVEALRSSVTGAWREGWQPAELVRHIGRELGQPHMLMAADMIIEEGRSYAPATVDTRWAVQVAALTPTVDADGTITDSTPDGKAWWGSDADYVDAWASQANGGGQTDRGGLEGAIVTAVEFLHELQHISPLEKLLPLPGTATRATKAKAATAKASAKTSAAASGQAGTQPADDRMLAKIRALLAKAESTEFSEEAEALSGRAQELMAKYSIDHALLAAQEGDEETPGGRRIPVDNPYEAPKVQLLNEVARANRCRTVRLMGLGLVTVIGFEADLDAVELLFTSLLVQANTAMLRAGAKKDEYGRSRTRAFRQSFLVAYAYRIGERLTEATESVVKEAAQAQEAAREEAGQNAPVGVSTALVPLLAAREEAVNEAVDEIFGDTLRPTRGARATDLEGWNSGRAAADLASLNNRDQVTT